MVYRRYLPNKVVAAGLPLLKSRGMMNEQARAFVCEGCACERPVVDPAHLAAQPCDA